MTTPPVPPSAQPGDPTSQPYGPPPGGQPPYGPPPSGQPPYGPPAGQPDFGPPQPPPPAKKAWWKQPVVLIVVALLVAGVVAFFLSRDNVQNAEVGDCVQIQTETEFNIVDCGADEASFRVLSVQDGGTASCTDPDVDSTIYTKGGSEKAWCLRMVVEVGDCIESDTDKVDCGAATAEYKVLEVLTNATDDTDCPAESTLYRPYAADTSVLCLGDPA